MGNTTSYSTNDYELVIKISKDLEYLLDTEFHANGKGLHEKINSISKEVGLSNNLIKKMRYLATIRNKLIHERGYDMIPDRNIFIKNYEESKEILNQILVTRNSQLTSKCIIS